jgi:hypothetical protein
VTRHRDCAAATQESSRVRTPVRPCRRHEARKPGPGVGATAGVAPCNSPRVAGEGARRRVAFASTAARGCPPRGRRCARHTQHTQHANNATPYKNQGVPRRTRRTRGPAANIALAARARPPASLRQRRHGAAMTTLARDAWQQFDMHEQGMGKGYGAVRGPTHGGSTQHERPRHRPRS